MTSLSGDEIGQGLLAQLAFKGISAARDKDWADIRALDLSLLKRYSQP
jgi:phosphonate transport system substrate-binding protein